MKGRRTVLFVGVMAMLGLVAGTFLQGGSLAQKLCFLIGAAVLTGIAYINKQKMYVMLEIVISISATIAFWDVSELWKYIIFVGAGIIGVWYLIQIKFAKEDKYWPIGGLGLLLIAAGLATSAAMHPMLFNAFLGLGGIFISIYSAVGLFYYKVKIAALWLILNIFFSLNPMMIVFSKLFS